MFPAPHLAPLHSATGELVVSEKSYERQLSPGDAARRRRDPPSRPSPPRPAPSPAAYGG